MPTIEESAAAFLAGREAFAMYPRTPLQRFDKLLEPDAPLHVSFNFNTTELFRIAADDFRDGWRSAQREAEIERRAYEGKA
jgi:hypothetical protein